MRAIDSEVSPQATNHRTNRRSAARRRRWRGEARSKSRRAISRAPSDARCAGVLLAVDHRHARAARQKQTSAASAIFDASVRCANIDSPKNMRPRLTPYSPPASSPSIQVSKLCTGRARAKRCRRRSSPARSRCRPGRRAAASRRRSMTRANARVDADRAARARRRSERMRLAQRARELELADQQHHARVGRPPQHRLAVAVPREHAAAVGLGEPRLAQPPPAASRPGASERAPSARRVAGSGVRSSSSQAITPETASQSLVCTRSTLPLRGSMRQR